MEVCIYMDEALASHEPTVADPERLEIESAIAHHHNMAELAGKAGLTSQASSHRQQARAAETKLLPPPPFPELTPNQFTVWQRFLPTAYSGPQDLSRYNYDLMPPQVLEIIGQYKNSFTTLVIRTSEKMKDPALFGIRNFGDRSATYLLARWGESQPIDLF